jgi:peptide/nickel transport system substrate-binding protein
MLRRFSSVRQLGGVLIGAVLCTTTILLDSCREEQSRYGGTVVLSTFEEPAGLNPLFYLDTLSPNIGSLIFNTLVNIDEQLEYVPELAESWQVSDDGRSWDFYLREGVTFHDGEELAAEDVVFTFRTLLDPANESPLVPFYSIVEKVEAVNSRRVRFHLAEPYSPFLNLLILEIIPEHLFGEDGITIEDFARNPVGTGSFRFESWDDDRIALSANASYFEGRPYLDRVEVRWYADQSRAWSALMQGDVDVVMDLELEDYRVIENDARFRTYNYLEVFYHTLLFNLKDPLFSDPDMRRALDLAIDRKDLIESTLNGWAVETTGPFRPGTWPYNPEVPAARYDPGEASRILADLGWRDIDGDLILEKDGRELAFTILADEGDLLKEAVARRIKWQLFQAGIRVEVELLPPQELFEERLFPGDFQAVILQFNAGADPDKFTHLFWHSDNIGYSNLGVYGNPEVDRLIEAGRTSLDFEERKGLYRRIHSLIARDRPALFLYVRKIFFATSAKLEGINAAPELLYPSIKDWYINQSQEERR